MDTLHDDHLTMGTFFLDDQEFGVDILQQREVLRMLPVTRVPCAEDYIEGVINLRGTIIPIVNLRMRFGMPRKPFEAVTRILNIEVTPDLVVGFIVDRVGKVRRIERKQIEPPPGVMASVDSEYISGVGKFEDSLLLVLNIPQVLSAEAIEALERLA